MFEWESLGAKEIGLLLLVVAAVHALFVVFRWYTHEPAITAHFSPKGGCTAAIVAEITAARSEVLVLAYSFSCPDIANALIAAAHRGVQVVILLDRSNEAETYSELGDLEKHGMKVWIDACHAIAHNKVMVIDHGTVITGSFNFTRQAEQENAENLLILRNHRELAASFRENFHVHRGHSTAPGTREPATSSAHGPHMHAPTYSRRAAAA